MMNLLDDESEIVVQQVPCCATLLDESFQNYHSCISDFFPSHVNFKRHILNISLFFRMPLHTEEDWSDSDDSIQSNIETSVLLGIPDGDIDNSVDILDPSVSRIGGRPVN